jgi:hypothetical protein
VHVAGMNLGLLLRSAYGIGTPRGLQGLSHALGFLGSYPKSAISVQRVAVALAQQ